MKKLILACALTVASTSALASKPPVKCDNYQNLNFEQRTERLNLALNKDVISNRKEQLQLLVKWLTPKK